MDLKLAEVRKKKLRNQYNTIANVYCLPNQEEIWKQIVHLWETYSSSNEISNHGNVCWETDSSREFLTILGGKPFLLENGLKMDMFTSRANIDDEEGEVPGTLEKSDNIMQGFFIWSKTKVECIQMYWLKENGF